MPCAREALRGIDSTPLMMKVVMELPLSGAERALPVSGISARLAQCSPSAMLPLVRMTRATAPTVSNDERSKVVARSQAEVFSATMTSSFLAGS